MKMSSIAALLLLAAAAGVQAQQAMKPGLWELKVNKLVNDGKDMSDSMAKMQQRLAALPPDQRAMVESRMQASGVGNGSVRVCISPAMAAKYQFNGTGAGNPRDSHCPSNKADISGNKVTFTINCTYEGNTTVGSGQAVMSGDSISIHSETKISGANGSHSSIADVQMNYVGSDCQGLKPADQK